MRLTLLSSLLLLTLLISVITSAQVKFYAEVPGKTVGKNDDLQLKLTVENAKEVQRIVPPVFKNFSLVSGPSEESSMMSINGSVKRTYSYVYILRPQATGTFTIGSATASADGKDYHSAPLTIKVDNTSHQQNSISPFSNLTMDELTVPSTHEYDDYVIKKGERVEDKIKKNLFVKLEVSKNSCYVGEPIVATYKLYSRLKSESNISKMPSFNGFSVSDIGKEDGRPAIEKVNGRQYDVYVLRRVQLYPLQPGDIALEPTEVENKITFLKEGAQQQHGRGDIYDMMRDFANDNVTRNDVIQERVIVKNEPLSIKVLPLPEDNKPSEFKGAVGSFRISASLDKDKITTDDAATLIVKIEGTGNIHLVNAPIVKAPTGMEIFEPKITEDIDKDQVPMRGVKTFSYPFIASSKGQYTIPPIDFAYLDNSTKIYNKLATEPLTVEVSKGKNTGPLALFSNGNDSGIWTRFKWTIISAIALLAGLIFWFVKGRKREPIAASANGNGHAAKTELSNIPPIVEAPKHPLCNVEEFLSSNQPGKFYTTLNSCMRKYLSEKFKVPQEEISRKNLSDILDRNGIGNGTALLLTSLMEDIELCLYAPIIGTSQMSSDYEKANEVIALLAKQVPHASVNL